MHGLSRNNEIRESEMNAILDILISEVHKQIMDTELEYVNTGELGEVIDMIKDISEALKYLSEEKYYNSVNDAMRSKSDRHYKPYVSQEPYMNDYLGNHEERMSGAIMAIRDIWGNANPEFKTHMKNDVQKLLNDMNA